MVKINTKDYITLAQAVKLTGQNARYIQRKNLKGLIQSLDVWGLNHRLYLKKDVRKFIKKEQNAKAR